MGEHRTGYHSWYNANVARGREANSRLSLFADHDLAKVSDALVTLGKSAEDFRGLWSRILPIMSQGTWDLIRSRGTLVGKPWDPLTVPYAKRKARAGFGTTPLKRTGAMLSQLVGVNAGLQRLSKMLVSWGSSADYAQAVSRGFYGRGFAYSPRRFIGWAAPMVEKVRATASSWADEVIAKAGTEIAKAKATQRMMNEWGT